MEFIKLVLSSNNRYEYQNASSSEMNTLELFLTSAIGHSKDECQFFKDWALADKEDCDNSFNYSIGTNITFLEEDDNGDIQIVDDTGSDPDDIYYIPARIKMTKDQFVQLLDDWETKVCKFKPKEVTITYDNGQFNIETSD